MTPLAQYALKVAESYLGVTEHPPGSNRGPEVDAWLRRRGLDPAAKSYPWCAAFLSACIEDAADALADLPAFKRSASCQRLVDLNPDLVLAAPEPGSVFVMLHPDHTGHTGFVVELAPGGGFTSLEGNSDAAGSRTGGSVVRNVRPAGCAQHFIAIR